MDRYDYGDPADIDPGEMPTPAAPWEISYPEAAAPEVDGVGVVDVVGGFPEGVQETACVLDDVRTWFARFICTMHDGDLDLLALWAAHTHLVMETYTTPRLVLDSPVPGSGKTTVLEHLQRLCVWPVQAASLSSPALLTRMLDKGMRTILIDEVDRSLDPKKDGVGDLIAVLNSGYKRGATRPVLVPVKGGGWDEQSMPTYSPVVMAGNAPNLPEDTKSRSIRVLLMPDREGRVEESDWELIEEDAERLGERLAQWADVIRVAGLARVPLPESVKGRARERWSPLKRVAAAAGGRWSAVVDQLAVNDVERIEAEREEGITQQRPHVTLVAHIHESFGEADTFVPTTELIARLIDNHPEVWGSESPFGKALTAPRLGRMLTSSYNVHATKYADRGQVRGYYRHQFATAFRAFALDLPSKPPTPSTPSTPSTPRESA